MKLTDTRAVVSALADVASRFSPEHRAKKLQLLAALAGRAIRLPATLERFHETLCFLRAYPDDAAVLARVEEQLRGFAGRVGSLPPPARARLSDSGIAGTSLTYPFGLPMTRWLLSRFPADVAVGWEGFEGGERLEEVLALLVTHPEGEAFSEGGLGWRAWLTWASAQRRRSELATLVELFDRSGLADEVRDWLFESLELPIVWRIRRLEASRTGARLPWPRPSFHPAGLRRADADFTRAVQRPAQRPRRAAPALAESVIEAARVAMATRARELYVFSHPNPDDVLIADAGDGLRIALIGLPPQLRLPLEVYYAFLVLKNGVPVGYGAGWSSSGALEFAFNVFEAFRQGESAHVFARVLAVYRQLLGVRDVVVDRFQIGEGNPEALRSGAFYFYYRLGFRPTDAAVLRLADAERAKIARDPAYRSSPAILRRLARSEMRLALSSRRAPEPRLTGAQVAALVTRHIAREWDGDRATAGRVAPVRVARALGVTGWRRWPDDERRAFARMALVVDLLPGLGRWPADERGRLARLMRAKGAPSQWPYARLLRGHHRLRRSLAVLALPRP